MWFWRVREHDRVVKAWQQAQEARGSHLVLQAWIRENKLEMAMVSKISKLIPSGVVIPARLYLLNLSKWHHQLETKYSNALDCDGHLSLKLKKVLT